MVRLVFVAGLLAACAAAPARAADPVAVTEKFLRDDEKALLAAVLTDKAAATEFEADVKTAVNPRVMKLVLDKWRGRLAAFAQSDAKHPNPDLEGTYRDYAAMLSAQIRAYLLRRLKTMDDNDRNSLIAYLDTVNKSLADNGKLSWYTKMVVAGIMDKYRGELTQYLGTTFARESKANAPAAQRALAASHRIYAETAAVTTAAAERKEAQSEKAQPERLAAKPKTGTATESLGPAPVVPVPTPTAAPMSPAATPAIGAPAGNDPSNDALEQARFAAEAAELSGEDFDGARQTGSVAGVGTTDIGTAVVVADQETATRDFGLTPPTRDAKPSLTAEPPSPGGDGFISNINEMRTGSGGFKPPRYLPGAAGALVGAALGFLVGGPLGALIGALIGLIAGTLIGQQIFK